VAKRVVVKGDPVDGTDTHGLSGKTASAPVVEWAGTGDYPYKGEVSNGLSEVVTVGSTPLALVTSGSTLRADGQQGHDAKLGGGNFQPAVPAPNPASLTFVPGTGIGDGKPSAGTGSAALTINGVKVLLDGDQFDTCGIPGGTTKAKVEAKGQDLVTCSA
jgi:hypothetical protein